MTLASHREYDELSRELHEFSRIDSLKFVRIREIRDKMPGYQDLI
jgi:hypothetical protein